MAQYYRVDPALRASMQAQWNRPVAWPLALPVLALLAVLAWGWRSWRQRENATARHEPTPDAA